MTLIADDKSMLSSLTARFARRGATVLGALAVVITAGCNVDNILDVTDPDIINPEDIASPAGAAALRNGALARLVQMTAGATAQQESFWLMGGLLADEWRSGDTFLERDETDRRNVRVQNSILEATQRIAHRARVVALQARKATETYDPAPAPWQIAEMFLVQGYAEIILAEHVCNGIPLSYVLNNVAVEGEPLTNAQVFTTALAHADSALALLPASLNDANSVRIRNRANLIKARALVDLNRLPEAAAAAALVPVGTSWFVRTSDNTWNNQIWSLNSSVGRYTLPDTTGGASGAEGPLGLNPVRAGDPRVPTCRRISPKTRADTLMNNACVQAGVGDSLVFDTPSGLRRWAQLIWTTRNDSAAITNGVEAKLIIAENLMRLGNATFVDTLNALRTNGTTTITVNPIDTTKRDTTYNAGTGGVAGLRPLTDPGTQTAREDLLFRERGFWLFSRGYRLGDLRRLMRQYNRAQNQVFPSGTYIRGGTYGTDVNFPVVQAEQNNPKFTACLDRDA